VLDGVDLSRTVGWFTTLFPVTLDGSSAHGWAGTIKSVKEQLRAVPPGSTPRECTRRPRSCGSPRR
jgi:hypothetical protein